jgi:uncharacterized membrane protein YoaK (UPF0700 family)
MAATSDSMQPLATTGGGLTIALLTLTFSTGVIDALSFIALGHVFTANMTGNIVFLAFAVGGTKGLSAARSGASLLAFMAGAGYGGVMNVRHAGWTRVQLLKGASAIEAALLFIAAGFATITGSKYEITANVAYGLITLTALAMGVRNAVVRKMAVPDLTTTVLTLTVTGFASDSAIAGGVNPRWRTRLASIISMFLGAATGAMLLRYGAVAPLLASSFVALLVFVWMATKKDRLAATLRDVSTRATWPWKAKKPDTPSK